MRILIIGLVTALAMNDWGHESHSGSTGSQTPETPAQAAVKPEAKPGPSSGHWIPLFNGRNLDGWYTFLQKHGKNSDPDHVITIEDGAIHLYKDAADASRVVMGYIGTEKEYGNYHLRLQYRWGTKKFEPRFKLKRDAGLYYHILGPDAVWPRALQFQIEQTNVGDLITLSWLRGRYLDRPQDRRRRDAHVPGPEARGTSACAWRAWPRLPEAPRGPLRA